MAIVPDQGGSLELGSDVNRTMPYIDFKSGDKDFSMRMAVNNYNNIVNNFGIFSKDRPLNIVIGSNGECNLQVYGNIKANDVSLIELNERLKVLENSSSGAFDGEQCKWNAKLKKWSVPQVKYPPSVNGQPNFIISLTGQSNSQGIGGFYDENNEDDQPHERILSWNQGYTSVGEGFPWYNEGGNIGWEVADLRKVLGTKMPYFQCMAFHFAKQLVTAYPDIIVGIINAGLGGQPIARWAIYDENDEFYNYNINRYQNQGDIFTVHTAMINNALYVLDSKKNVDVFLWHQGESDGNLLMHGGEDVDPKYYKRSIEKVIKQYRNLSFSNSQTPFIVGETTGADFNGTDVGWEARNIELRALNKDSDPYTRCILTSDLTYGTEEGYNDLIHFSSESHRKIGKLMALEYKSMIF